MYFFMRLRFKMRIFVGKVIKYPNNIYSFALILHIK